MARVEIWETYHIPEGITLRDAALVEPSALAIHAVNQADVRPGQAVLIIGGGPIRLLTK